ncbi:MAG: hypothetical protein ACYDHY_17295 [Acidiferrobacterales bacterium]
MTTREERADRKRAETGRRALIKIDPAYEEIDRKTMSVVNADRARRGEPPITWHQFMTKGCKFEFVELGNGERICKDVLAWRSRLDDCCGQPRLDEIRDVVAAAPGCLAWHGNNDDTAAWCRLVELASYLGKQACSR